jgi:succinate dehydrogenase/fumarate reductase cytochrome b subunit
MHVNKTLDTVFYVRCSLSFTITRVLMSEGMFNFSACVDNIIICCVYVCVCVCLCEHAVKSMLFFHTDLPYILESNLHPNLIRTSFCRFLKRKKC